MGKKCHAALKNKAKVVGILFLLWTSDCNTLRETKYTIVSERFVKLLTVELDQIHWSGIDRHDSQAATMPVEEKCLFCLLNSPPSIILVAP
jgi:hypothetical protein